MSSEAELCQELVIAITSPKVEVRNQDIFYLDYTLSIIENCYKPIGKKLLNDSFSIIFSII